MNHYYDLIGDNILPSFNRHNDFTIRIRLNTFLKKFNYRNRNYSELTKIDHALYLHGILVYTDFKKYVYSGKPEWWWNDLKPKTPFLTLRLQKKKYKSPINPKFALKMESFNEISPSIPLLEKYLSTSKEILFCVAYLDEEMIHYLTGVCSEKNIKIRVVSDINFNSNVYKRPIIRAKIENAGGEFRVTTGSSEEGIMHTKLYVFYHHNQSVTVFNGSANFTANAWKNRNQEAPITVQHGTDEDSQIAILINAADNVWKRSVQNTNLNNLKQLDKVSHTNFGNGTIFQVTGENAQVIFGETIRFVKIEELSLIIDPLMQLKEGQAGVRDNLYRTKSKFLANYIYAQNSITNEFYDYKIQSVPHQLLALKKAVTSKNGGNLLFADDVGLGKTIEAGLVIQNVIRRIGDSARVLIMTPAGLKWQWYLEMNEKFGLNFSVWGWDTVGGSEAFSSGFQGRNLMIASYYKMIAGEMDDAIRRNIHKFDLIVIDECHKFGNENQFFRLARDIRRENKAAQLLLLSATPHSGDRFRFLNLLHLLDMDTFPKESKTQESLLKIDNRELINEYIYRNDKLSVRDFNNQPIFKNVKTESVRVTLNAEEEKFCDLVMVYITKLHEAKQKAEGNSKVQIGFVISIYRKMLSSSWKNLFRSMKARYFYLIKSQLADIEFDDLFDPEEDLGAESEEREVEVLMKKMKSDKIFSTEIDCLKPIITKGLELEKNNIDTKVHRLLEIVNGNDNKDKKFIIFTQFVKTLDIIKEALGGSKNVAEIQGSIKIDERKGQVEKFKNKVRFMVSTEAGGEGINLQFASHVINFDMPWNPARLQQRIGRVWRYGQENDVKCYNFFVMNEVLSDQQVLDRLNEKLLNIIRDFLLPLEYNGMQEDRHEALEYDLMMRVLGEVQAKDENANIESIIAELNETLQEERLAQAENRMKEALEFVRKEQKYLSASTGIQLEELKSFYAPQEINFLKQFAESFSRSMGGQLVSLGNDFYQFTNLDLSELNLSPKLFENRIYTFKQGVVKDKKSDENIYFFGFGDEFFNTVIDIVRKPSFGGQVAFLNNYTSSSFKPKAVLLATSRASSVSSDEVHPENYHLCSFVSVEDGIEVLPEQLFGEEWSEENASPVNLALNEAANSIHSIFDKQKEKIRALRPKKDFALTDIHIDAAIGNPY